MGPELLFGLPRGPLQGIVLERVDEDFRLVQPRGVGRRIARLPPPVTLGEVPLGCPCDVACATILDQENALQLLVMLAIQFQFREIVDLFGNNLNVLSDVFGDSLSGYAGRRQLPWTHRTTPASCSERRL